MGKERIDQGEIQAYIDLFNERRNVLQQKAENQVLTTEQHLYWTDLSRLSLSNETRTFELGGINIDIASARQAAIESGYISSYVKDNSKVNSVIFRKFTDAGGWTNSRVALCSTIQYPNLHIDEGQNYMQPGNLVLLEDALIQERFKPRLDRLANTYSVYSKQLFHTLMRTERLTHDHGMERNFLLPIHDMNMFEALANNQ